ncbi:hypothetical protein FNU76_00605 [Chitinimonas arctica]|uniref:Uncharacterized protein n=1 Tax=Chitinimonas arctica TaxID=2594795 RepID=A0A516S9Y4_9NEIS|nr:hypothetical protein [Chitinimonas arctica]QDQ24965.1 hypothetical protein FNU76_00605 [Chitinimonas arctica]
MNLKKKPSNAPKTKEQKRIDLLKRHGVESPQTRNMARNVTMTRIENFDRSKLKPLQPQQRYIYSPHDDIGNLFDNTLSMTSWGHERNLPGIRPVFKDQNQRKAFLSKIEQELANPSQYTLLDPHSTKSLAQLKKWSTQDGGLTDFKSISTKRGAPIVYTQGHGQPGDLRIRSNANQYVSATDVAQQLHDKGLTSTSEVRANSCYSGTQHRLFNDVPDIGKHFAEQSIDNRHAGTWTNTFAGSMQQKLQSLGHHGRVTGYVGPTGIDPETVKTVSPFSKVSSVKGMSVELKPSVSKPQSEFYKRSQMRRFQPLQNK